MLTDDETEAQRSKADSLGVAEQQVAELGTEEYVQPPSPEPVFL